MRTLAQFRAPVITTVCSSSTMKKWVCMMSSPYPLENDLEFSESLDINICFKSELVTQACSSSRELSEIIFLFSSQIPEFPEKRLFGKDSNFMKQRMAGLQAFFDALL